MLAIRETQGTMGAQSPLGRLLALAALVTVASFAALPAHALQYFNGPGGFGFDNTTLMLDADFEFPVDPGNPGFPFEGITGGNTGGPVGLSFIDLEMETFGDPIDRTVEWTILNNDAIDEIMIVFSGLLTMEQDYLDATIDITSDDGLDIAFWDGRWLAGFQLDIDDFTDVNGTLTATRTFRYTIDVAQIGDAPPGLGLQFTRELTSVPEPATGLLLVGALLATLGAGRKQAA